ncbi:hypothetical protein M3650_02310 [Paenibacillus sp. MER TA 81-3]|nr:hypothetical protein [Paenibacillus sp. MER TA 81-3]MCM3337509.1 hypothetical protein [Paenibacillus sp. MER TA 81-3]
MDKTTKNGLKNLEKTIKAQDFTQEEKDSPHVETVKSEKIRYENADSIYE